MGLGSIVPSRPPATISAHPAAPLGLGWPMWSFHFSAACRQERVASHGLVWLHPLVQPPSAPLSRPGLAGKALWFPPPACPLHPAARACCRLDTEPRFPGQALAGHQWAAHRWASGDAGATSSRLRQRGWGSSRRRTWWRHALSRELIRQGGAARPQARFQPPARRLNRLGF
jgi:hypothetical protein